MLFVCTTVLVYEISSPTPVAANFFSGYLFMTSFSFSSPKRCFTHSTLKPLVFALALTSSYVTAQETQQAEQLAPITVKGEILGDLYGSYAGDQLAIGGSLSLLDTEDIMDTMGRRSQPKWACNLYVRHAICFC